MTTPDPDRLELPPMPANVVSAADPTEAALLAALGRPGAGWVAASQLARQLGYPRAEVARALIALAARGEAERMIEWASDMVIPVWRYRRQR